ncbi:MAG: hypothetical protein SynsKO_01160 [Synoicihabitans sp.]
MPKPILPFRDPATSTTAIAHLRNLGPKSAEMLADIGVTNREELATIGAIAACVKLREKGHRVSLNMAYAIEGALMDADWRALPPEFRQDLQMQWEKTTQWKG